MSKRLHLIWYKEISHVQKRCYSAPGDRSIPLAKQKYVPKEGEYPKGFRVGTAHVGVKPSNTSYDDLTLITSDTPCVAAGVFTRNLFKAAPVTVCKELLKKKRNESFRSVIINSGCANAVTGSKGIEDAWSMCRAADAALGVKAESDADNASSSLVMSTGVIGQRLPIEKIIDKVPKAAGSLGSTHDHWLSAAQAICTTDTFPKLISREFTLPTKPADITFRMVGMAKGAGMIHPNMGTLLGVVCTDAPMDTIEDLDGALRVAADHSFNRISIDGDTSTNDTLLLLSNGQAGQIVRSDESADMKVSPPRFVPGSAYAEALRNEITAMCTDLAKLVVRDGEGATKFITIRVRGARTPTVAHAVAQTIAKSPLFKTAMYGQDANWGRILCAIGYSALEHPDAIPSGQSDINPDQITVSFVPASKEQEDEKGLEELLLLLNGEPQQVDERKAARMLQEEDLEILVRLRLDHKDELNVRSDDWRLKDNDFSFWTCDLSHEYVTINGDYRT